MTERRPVAIRLDALGIRSNDGIQVPRLKLVGMCRQCLKVADAVVTHSSRKNAWTKSQGREGGVAPGTAPHDALTLRVNPTALSKKSDCRDTVLDVGFTPPAIQCPTVVPTETGTATVIDIDNRKSARRPELDTEPVSGTDGTCRTTVAQHDHWR